MPNMLERIARAIRTDFDSLPKTCGERKVRPDLPTQGDVLESARRVLETMQEPTDEMVAACVDLDTTCPPGAADARKYFRAMISAAGR